MLNVTTTTNNNNNKENSLILPQFDYADVVYDSCTETDKDRLQILQTKAAQILTGSKPSTHRMICTQHSNGCLYKTK